jgi:hypothetical protein
MDYLAELEALCAQTGPSTADHRDDEDDDDDEDEEDEEEDEDAEDAEEDDDEDWDEDAEDAEEDDDEDGGDEGDDDDDGWDDDDDEYDGDEDNEADQGRRRYALWPVGRLQPHPQEATIFGGVPEAEVAALAAGMDKDGLRQRVEILPDGTVIAGYPCVLAARCLGWSVIDVTVCGDLAAAGPTAVELHLLTSNVIRRQLRPLGRARCVRRFMELEQERTVAPSGSASEEALKARVGERIGLAVRSVDRYLLLLRTPPEVQAAFDADAITLDAASEVAVLDGPAQEEVARRIAAGEPARTVVAEALIEQMGGAESVDAAYARLLRALRREVPRLAGHLQEIDSTQLRSACSELRGAAALLGEMVALAGAQAGAEPPSPAAGPHHTAAAKNSKKGRSAARAPRRRRTG